MIGCDDHPGPEAAWRPRILDPHDPDDVRTLAALVADPATRVVDSTATRSAGRTATRSAGRVVSRAPGQEPIRWIYYAWSRTLVCTWPPGRFREIRLSRNRDKITAAEQDRLGRATIAVVGLSVGRQIVRTLAMEGIGGRFRLADPDILTLSNLNRLPAGIPDLGVPKTTLAARDLLELDPYLDIQLFPEGVDGRSSQHSLDAFLAPGGDVPDLVIEECDDFAVKVAIRRRARQLGIPVIMESSIRGTLDIERFDLQPDRPLLHGLLEEFDPGQCDSLEAKKALIGHLLPHMSDRTRGSIERVGIELDSWPQLASDVALGAALVAVACRKILLGRPLASGRYILDLDASLDRGPNPVRSSTNAR